MAEYIGGITHSQRLNIVAKDLCGQYFCRFIIPTDFIPVLYVGDHEG